MNHKPMLAVDCGGVDLVVLPAYCLAQAGRPLQARTEHARKEGYLLKLKRFSDSEAEVLGVVELMHNGNEAKTNALGHTERSSHKAGKVGMGVLGALQVRDCKTGVEFEIGTGFTAEDRRLIWQEKLMRGNYSPIGKLVKYKYFAGGSKDKPRFPVFLGWRDKIDT